MYGMYLYVLVFVMYRRAEKFREEKFSLFSRMAQIREILSAKICLHEI